MTAKTQPLDPAETLRGVTEACDRIDNRSIGPAEVMQFMTAVGDEQWRHFIFRRLFRRVPSGLLVKLIKICTLHGLISGKHLGSATPIPHMIQQLPSPLRYEMEIWAFHTTNNGYIPFGTINRCRYEAESVSDYHRLLVERDERIETSKQEALKRRQKIKQERAALHEGRMKLQRARSKQRAELIERIASIEDSLERLRQIAEIVDFPPYAMPTSFADIGHSSIVQLGYPATYLLMKRLRNSPRGKWRQLYSGIVQCITPKH